MIESNDADTVRLIIPDNLPADSTEFYGLIQRMIDIHDAKRKDYAPGEDRFKNFRQSESMGVPAWVGALIRTGDKWSRIVNLTHRLITTGGGPAVKDESIEDTLMDLAIYALIVIELYRQWKGNH